MASINGGTRCRRRNCKYATGTNDRIYYRCNYFQCTLSTRTKAICDLMGLRYDDPKRFEYLKPDKCPVYEKAGGRAKRKNISLPQPSVKRPRYDWEKARKLHGEGFTDEEIAEAIGSAVTTVRNWRLAQDLPVNHKTRKAGFDWELAKKLYDQGKNDREISEVIGCEKSTVRMWRVRSDLPVSKRRGRGGI